MMVWRCRGSASLLDGSAGGLDARGCRVDRRQAIGRVGNRADEQLFQFARAREQNLALVGEVPEERSLCEPRPVGDLSHRGPFEPTLAVELQRRLQATESLAGL